MYFEVDMIGLEFKYSVVFDVARNDWVCFWYHFLVLRTSSQRGVNLGTLSVSYCMLTMCDTDR